MKGECTGNVIPTGRLSSGYYEYTAAGADDYVVPKPDGAGEYLQIGSISFLLNARIQ